MLELYCDMVKEFLFFGTWRYSKYKKGQLTIVLYFSGGSLVRAIWGCEV